MSEYKDWKITLEYNVPPNDTEGVFTEALFDAADGHAPSAAEGLGARADTVAGKVWVVFTLVDTSPELADEITSEMSERILEAVKVSRGEACVSAA